MKLKITMILLISIAVLGMPIALASPLQISGGVIATGGVSGILTPTSNTFNIDGNTFTDSINDGDMQKYDALLGYADDTYGTVSVARYSKPTSPKDDSSGDFGLIGFKAPIGGIKVTYSSSKAPTTVGNAGAQIQEAFKTWDSVNPDENRKFFSSDTGTVSAPFSWKPLGGNIIAVTSIRANWDRNQGTYILTQTNCQFNNRFRWEIDSDDDTIGEITRSERDNIFDVRTIALHEQGHMLGLDDLYASADSYLTMYGYNDGHSDWTLADGDIAGIDALYTPPTPPK